MKETLTPEQKEIVREYYTKGYSVSMIHKELMKFTGTKLPFINTHNYLRTNKQNLLYLRPPGAWKRCYTCDKIVELPTRDNTVNHLSEKEIVGDLNKVVYDRVCAEWENEEVCIGCLTRFIKDNLDFEEWVGNRRLNLLKEYEEEALLDFTNYEDE